MSLKEAQQKIDSQEFSSWMAYYMIEPWGQQVDDYRFGMLACTTANSFSSSKGRKPKIDDYIFKWDKQENDKINKAEILRKKLMALAKQHNARFKKKVKK